MISILTNTALIISQVRHIAQLTQVISFKIKETHTMIMDVQGQLQKIVVRLKLSEIYI